MSISSIDSYYTNAYYTMLQTTTTNADGTTSTSESVVDDDSSTSSLADQLLTSSSSYWGSDNNTSISGMALDMVNLTVQNAYAAYSTTDTSSTTSSLAYLESLATSAAEDLGLSSVTFSDLVAHKDYLVEEFSSLVSEGLEEAGVSSDADFRLSMDENGSLLVQSNHADAEAIQAFFDANPQFVEAFEHIDALDQLEQTRLNNSYDLSSVYSQSMQASISSSMSTGYSSQAITMAFTEAGSNMSILQLSGINTTA